MLEGSERRRWELEGGGGLGVLHSPPTVHPRLGATSHPAAQPPGGVCPRRGGRTGLLEECGARLHVGESIHGFGLELPRFERCFNLEERPPR